MIEDLQDLEGEFFIVNDEDQEWIYRTICYGVGYDWSNKRENYYLNIIVTEETQGEIWYDRIWQDEIGLEDFQKPDKKYYSSPWREFINRVFELDWV